MDEGMAPEMEARLEALIEADIELPEAEAPSTSDMSGLGKAVLIAAADVSEPAASSSASTTGPSSASSTAGSKQGDKIISVYALMNFFYIR